MQRAGDRIGRRAASGPAGSAVRSPASSSSLVVGPLNSASQHGRRRRRRRRAAPSAAGARPSSPLGDEEDAARARPPRRPPAVDRVEQAALVDRGCRGARRRAGSRTPARRAPTPTSAERSRPARVTPGRGRRRPTGRLVGAGSVAGSSITKRAPGSPSGRSSTQTRPPCMRTCSSTSARPRPAPSLPAAPAGGRRRGRSARRSAPAPRSGTPGPWSSTRDLDVGQRLVGQVGVGDRDLGLAAAVGAGVVDQVGDAPGRAGGGRRG